MLAPARPQDSLDALIKEARERQFRRRMAVAALVMAAAVVGYTVARPSGSKPTASQSALPGTAAFAVSPACEKSRRPRLFLSRHSGPPGTVVSITGCGCPYPVYARAGGWWEDTRQALLTDETKLSHGRQMRYIRRSRTSATGTFTVPLSSSTGRALVDMWCGPGPGNGWGNGVAFFTVTS